MHGVDLLKAHLMYGHSPTMVSMLHLTVTSGLVVTADLTHTFLYSPAMANMCELLVLQARKWIATAQLPTAV